MNRLYRNLVSIIPRISQERLSPEEARQIGLLWELADLVEIMGDSIKELATSRRHRIFQVYQVSEETRAHVLNFQSAVLNILDKALDAIAQLGLDPERSLRRAREVIAKKKEINQLADAFKQYLQVKRLHEEREADGHLAADRIRLYAVETDLVARLKSSANFARKIAKAVLGTFSDQDIGTAQPGKRYQLGDLSELHDRARRRVQHALCRG